MTTDFLESVCDADSVEDLWALYTAKMAEFGFDRLLYGFTRFKTATSLGDTLDSLILTNYDEDYVKEYVDTGLYYHAPMLRWTLENTGACSWSWMDQLVDLDAFTESERKVIALNQAKGITAGYTISFKSSTARTKGGIAMAGKPGLKQADVDAIWQKHGQEISVISNVVHLKIISLPYASSRRALTNRQREVLEWVGDGKTMQDIATIMGLTSATVEKHLRLAREALDVDTTAQAVLKASFQNQIFLLEA